MQRETADVHLRISCRGSSVSVRVTDPLLVRRLLLLLRVGVFSGALVFTRPARLALITVPTHTHTDDHTYAKKGVPATRPYTRTAPQNFRGGIGPMLGYERRRTLPPFSRRKNEEGGRHMYSSRPHAHLHARHGLTRIRTCVLFKYAVYAVYAISSR